MVADESRYPQLASRDEALRELNAARVALGAALAANRNSRERGRPEPCDERAIASLTQDVLNALTVARAAGLDREVSQHDALTFFVPSETETGRTQQAALEP